MSTNAIIMSRNIRAVDLFSGCGGMSLGFMNSGVEICAAFDYWDPAISVYRRNFKHDVHKQDLSLVAESVKRIEHYHPNLIIGGPPCQDFSTAGHQDENGGRAKLSIDFARIVTAIMPTWFVMENVATIRNTNAYATICDAFHLAGYGLTCKVLNAAYCGVPQIRKRMFIVGELGVHDNFLDEELEGRLSNNPMSIRDYLGDSLGIDYYFRVPTNYNRRAVFSVDEPAMTIRAVDRPIPPGYKGNKNDSAPVSKSRALTPKERSYIQTFPPEFEFFGSQSDINTMIGNAVPVRLAEFVASALLEHVASSYGASA